MTHRSLVSASAAATMLVLTGCTGGALTDSPDESRDSPTDRLPVWSGLVTLDGTFWRSGSGATLSATLTVRNVGADHLSLIYAPPACSLEMRAYTTADRDGAPFWQREAGTSCRSSLFGLPLAPGASGDLFGEISVGVPYDDLPIGTTYFSARMILSDPDRRTPELAAGEYYREE